jgi:hypothetical protein
MPVPASQQGRSIGEEHVVRGAATTECTRVSSMSWRGVVGGTRTVIVANSGARCLGRLARPRDRRGASAAPGGLRRHTPETTLSTTRAGGATTDGNDTERGMPAVSQTVASPGTRYASGPARAALAWVFRFDRPSFPQLILRNFLGCASQQASAAQVLERPLVPEGDRTSGLSDEGAVEVAGLHGTVPPPRRGASGARYRDSRTLLARPMRRQRCSAPWAALPREPEQ